MNRFKIAISIMQDKHILFKALKIAFIVGFILNLINQNEALVSLNFEALNLTKFFLTFCVPFAVSMYTAVTMKMKFTAGYRSACDITLKCKACNEDIVVKKDEIIPFCEKCKDKTKYELANPDTPA